MLAANVPANVPIAVGVPPITPVAELRVSPVGRLPDISENVGGGMPVATKV